MPEVHDAALLATLLAERDWVRRLARSLVASEADADDVEQETWLAAVRRSPPDRSRPRAWLGTVVRNQARLLWRRSERRDRRERAAARPEATVSAAEAVAHADALRRVVGALVDLREPYRGALVLRYFEGLAPDAIAAQERIPVDTVKTRLRRGLELMRERLDAGEGSDRRRALLLLVAGGGDRPASSAAAAAGGAIVGMNVKTTAAALAAALLVAAGVFWWTRDDDAGSTRTDVTAAATPKDRAPRHKAAAASATATPETPPAVARLEGRVLDESGAPIAGAAVTSPLGDAGTNDAGGFSLGPVSPPTPSSVVLRASHAGYRTLESSVALPPSAPVELRLAKSPRVRGHVFDQTGRSVDGASVVYAGVALAVGQGGSFEVSLDDPAISDVVVLAHAYRPVTIRAANLRRAADVYLWKGHPCRIRVVDEAGAPLAGAMVRLSSHWGASRACEIRVKTNADGRTPDLGVAYEGDADRGVGHETPVDVSLSGYASARVVLQQSTEPFDRTIVLRKATSVRVRLATSDGAPAAGWTVGLHPRLVDVYDPGVATEGRVDATGDALLANVEPGREYVVAATQRDGGPESFVAWTILAESHLVPRGADGAAASWSGRLPALQPVRFAVRDETGSPVADCTLRVQWPPGSANERVRQVLAARDAAPAERTLFALRRGSVASVRTDERGEATVALAAGDHALEVRSAVVDAVSSPILFTVGSSGASVDVPVRRGVAMSGDLKTDDGRAIPGVEVWFRTQDQRRLFVAKTDERGAFTATGLPQGRFEVSAQDPTGNYAGTNVSSVDVPREEPLHLVVAVHTLRGKVTGGPRVGYLVTCARLYGQQEAVMTWSDLDGNFAIDDLSDGEWLVLAMEGNHNGTWQGRVDGVTEIVVEIKK